MTPCAALLLCVAPLAQAQQRTLTGRVTATGTNEPLASASVQVAGTTIGTYTTEDGRFTLRVPEGPITLNVRRIGFQRRTVNVPQGQSDLAIALERDVLQLETQVITGTATSVARANAANAVAQVTAEELTRAPAQSIDKALQGKIPGATISTNSGAPGSGTQVQLRGVTSVNASSSPLFVIDGVLVNNSQIGNGLNSITNAGGGISNSQDQMANRIVDIDPNTIESIEVLKGPSAGAIYGSAGSNGVIVIRTKRGLSGAPHINFTQRLGTYQISKKLDLRCFSSQAEAEDWNGGPLPTGVTFTPTCHDFQGEFYKPDGPSYESILSVNGGASTGTTYFVSGSVRSDRSIQRGTYINKQSILANIGQTIGSRLTLQANNNFIHTLRDAGVSGNDNSPIASPGDVFSATPQFFDLGARDANGNYPVNPFLSEGTNPWQTADVVKEPEDVFRYIGGITANYSAITTDRQSLTFTAVGGVDTYQYNSRIVSPPYAYFEPADGFPGTIVTNKSSNVFANVNASGVHKLTMPAFTATTSFGLRRQYRQNDVILNQGRTIPPGVVNVSFAVNQALTESQNLIKDLGLYAQEEMLAFDERLLLTAAINAERSSVNGDPTKYYSYPKFAASYRVPFAPAFLDELKIRSAYGKAGNQPPYGFAFTSLPTGVYGGFLGARTSTVAGNANIRPETSAEIEGGIDAQLFKGRVGLEATTYRKTVTDLILQAAVQPSSGFTTRYINGGKMHTNGLELGLSMSPVQLQNIGWTSRTTYSRYTNRVDTIPVPCFNGGSFFSTRYGAPWVCSGAPITAVQVVDECKQLSASGTCAAANRVLKVYDSAPKFQMGFSNDLTIAKNIRISTLFDWRKGGRVANLTNNYFDGDNLFADTAMSQQRLRDFAAGKGVYLEDGGFLKLRELTVSFLLPSSLTNQFIGRGHDLRLEFAGRNLKTWTKYTGYDPEVSNFGNQNIGRFQDVTPYPPNRNFFVSLMANF